MHRLASLSIGSALVSITACDLGDRALSGECPAGETCSDGTPSGLSFDGASFGDGFLDFGPHPTLVGGTQNIRLEYAPYGNGSWRSLDLPYRAVAEGARGLEVAKTEGPIVTLRGVGDVNTYLRITDLAGDLFDRKKLAGSALTGIQIRPTRSEAIPAAEAVVFSAGTVDLTVELTGTTGRAVDESMVVDLAGATRVRWDGVRLLGATVGTYPMTITAGGSPRTVDLEVVAGPDTLVAQPVVQAIAVGEPAFVCFSAHAGVRYVAGLTWTFGSDNGEVSTFLSPNCAVVTPLRTGPLRVTANAGGLALSSSYTVVEKPPAVVARPAGATGSPLGERAESAP